MEEFTQLFGNLLAFVYHCFDRIVLHGYLSGLSRPEQVVYFVRQVLGLPGVNKEVLSQRTGDYRDWVEAYARNHHLPMEWAEKGVRKEDYVSPRLHRLIKNNAYGVYFIFKSMEQGRTFRISVPKYPTADPNYRILAHQRSRFTHYYFYIRDEVLGPIVLRVGSFFPFHATYWLNGHSFMEQELNRSRIGFHRRFVGMGLDENTPDHTTISRTRRLIDVETHGEVFGWVLGVLADRGLVKGKRIAIDATTLEANAAMRSIVRRDTGESYEEFLRGLAKASGIETPSREDLARLDRKRKKRTSNKDWESLVDGDARIAKMKDGRTHLAHKAEHAVDLDTGAVVAVTLQGADLGDTVTLDATLSEAGMAVAELVKSEAEQRPRIRPRSTSKE